MSTSSSARLLGYNDTDKHYERLHMDKNTKGNCLMVIDDESNSSLNTMKEHTGLISSRALLIANHLTQNADGSGSKAGQILDGIDSSLNTIESESVSINSRMSNVQDWVGTSDGAGGGVKTGVNIAEILVDTDQCVSKLTTIETQSVSINSRMSNVQDWVGTSDGAGGGAKTGVNIASLAGCVGGSELQVDIVSGSVSVSGGATEAKQDTQETTLNAIETLLTTQATANDLTNTKLTSLETDVEATNTLLTTMDAVVDNILTKNTEIDVACDLNNSRGDELYMDTHVAHISNGAIAQWALMSASGGAEIDMVGSTGYQYRDVTIYGKTTTSTAKLHFAGASSSGGTFYINPTYASLQADNSSNYHFIMTWENCPFRYVDVLASVAPAGLYISSIKSKHR